MVFRFLDFELDAALCELRQDGVVLTGDRRILDLLLYLIRNRDRVVPRAELLSEVWGAAPVSERALHQALYAARKLLGDDVREPRVLATLRARGVRFIADVVELTRRRGPAAAPLPGVGPFVGREDALADLQEALEGAQEGQGGLVLVSGEAGIGKSRLCEKFAERAQQQGVLVHVGRCLDTEGAPAFRPWIQLLRSHVERVGTEAWTAQAEEWPDVAQIAPELSPGGPRPRTYSELDVGPVRFRVFDGVSRFWMEIARETPRLLLLEDVQFADESTWQLLRFMVRDAAEANVLLVATYRDGELQAVPGRGEAVGEMLREAGNRALEVSGFSAEEVGEYLELVLDRPVASDVCEILRQRCAGNPFFLSHLAPLLGSDEEERNASRRSSLPTSLRDAIKFQLAALPGSVRTLLEAAAVGGADVALEVLADTTDRDRDGLLADLRPALASGVVRQDHEREGVLRFSHSLVAEALYESLPDSEQARWHHRLAVAIERTYKANPGPHLAQLAHHYGLSVDDRDTEKTILYCTRAGLAACDQFAFDEAIPLLQRALDLARRRGADAATLCDILLPLGEAQTRVGDRHAARETFRHAADLASSIGAPERLADVALAVAPGFFAIEVGYVDPFTVSLVQRALASEGQPPHLKSELEARLAMAINWSGRDSDRHRRLQLIESARHLADASTSMEAKAFLKIADIAVNWSPDGLGERIEDCTAALGLAEQASQYEFSLIARVFRISSYLEKGSHAELERDIDELTRILNDRRFPQASWYVPLYRAMLALQRGDLREAEAHAAEVQRIGSRFGGGNVTQSYSVLMFAVRWHQGRGGEIIDGLSNMVSDFPELTAWRTALAMNLAREGFRSEALFHYEAMMERGGALIRRDMMWLVCMVQLADTCADLGDIRNADALLEALSPYVDRYVSVGYGAVGWGSVARAAGRLAILKREWDRAEALFETAKRVETRAGAAVWLPYTHAALAGLLITRGRSRDGQRAVNEARRAVDLASRRGVEVAKMLGERALRRALQLA